MMSIRKALPMEWMVFQAGSSIPHLLLLVRPNCAITVPPAAATITRVAASAKAASAVAAVPVIVVTVVVIVANDVIAVAGAVDTAIAMRRLRVLAEKTKARSGRHGLKRANVQAALTHKRPRPPSISGNLQPPEP
jgi:hypothetical protein